MGAVMDKVGGWVGMSRGWLREGLDCRERQRDSFRSGVVRHTDSDPQIADPFDHNNEQDNLVSQNSCKGFDSP